MQYIFTPSFALDVSRYLESLVTLYLLFLKSPFPTLGGLDHSMQSEYGMLGSPLLVMKRAYGNFRLFSNPRPLPRLGILLLTFL